MSVLKIVIPGDYWDVQIYRGQLHLWTMSGSVTTLGWDRLAESVSGLAVSPFAVRIGFAKGAVLYGRDLAALRAEQEFRDWLLARFDAQSEQDLIADSRAMSVAMEDEQENPLADLPVDTEIYNRKLYAATDRGIWKASVGRGTVHPISTRPTWMHDVPAVSVRARSQQLALAATGDGLFTLGTGDGDPRSSGLQQLSGRHCDGADWVFQSVFATSDLSGGYLVSRYWGDGEDVDDLGSRSPFVESRRDLLDGGTHSVTAVSGALDAPEASWAYGEKIYTAVRDRLASSLYRQQEIPNGIATASTALGDIELSAGDGRALGGGTSVFGAIIEFDAGLLVVQSDETQLVIDGPITRWRTYPRAVNYENHLHVIFDDRIEIFAFYKDFFVDQRSKQFGVEYSAPGRIYGLRGRW